MDVTLHICQYLRTTGEIPSSALPILIQSLKFGIEARRDMRVLVTLVEHAIHLHFNIFTGDDFQQQHQIIIHHFVPADIGDV